MKTFKKAPIFYSLVSLSMSLLAPLGAKAGVPPTYDQMYPYYADYCSVSTIIPKDDRGPGGAFGHSALYIKGICRDKNASYPRVQLCPESMDINDPETGVGISVDNMYDNVVWVAVDGKKDFFHGGLPAGATLNIEQHRKTEHELLQKGYFRGIHLNAENLKNRPANMSEEEFTVHMSMGTDAALDFGRNIHCARIPLKKGMLPKMIQYLNSRNDEHATTGISYKWNPWTDNCAHLAYNTFAAAGIVPMKSLSQPSSNEDLYGNATTSQEPKTSPFAIPGRVFVKFAELTNEGPTDLYKLYQNPLAKELLLKYGWVATQPGALYVYNPIRPAPLNSVYESNIPMNETQWTIGKAGALNRIRSETTYSDLRANLIKFKGIYAREWQHYTGMQRGLLGSLSLRNPEFNEFYQAYGRYLQNQIQMVDQQLKSLSGN